VTKATDKPVSDWDIKFISAILGQAPPEKDRHFCAACGDAFDCYLGLLQARHQLPGKARKGKVYCAECRAELLIET
jgi:hypothetical protein